MTTAAAIIIGLITGYIVGVRQKAFVIFTGLFLVVLAFQSFIWPLTPWNRHIDVHDPGYWLVQPAMLVLGLGLTWLGGKIKEKRARRLSPA